MKLAPLFFAVVMMFLASLGLWALQFGGAFEQRVNICGQTRFQPG